MKNDCIILKKKNMNTVAKAPGNKPDYIIYIRVVANETIEHRVAMIRLLPLLILEVHKVTNFSIKGSIRREKFKKILNFGKTSCRKGSSKCKTLERICIIKL